MSDNINVKENEIREEIAEANAPEKAAEKPVQDIAENLEARLSEVKAEGRLTPEYIMAQIEKLIAERDHITQALSVLRDSTSTKVPNVPEDVAGQARFTAIADVVKCRETTIQHALNFYYEAYEGVKPSQLDIAIAQAQKMMSLDYNNFNRYELFDLIKEVYVEGLRNDTKEESSLEFKKRVIMEHVRCERTSPMGIENLLAILDD